MLITITNTAHEATDLGFLLHKNPANLHSADLAFGKAHVAAAWSEMLIPAVSIRVHRAGALLLFSVWEIHILSELNKRLRRSLALRCLR